MKETTHDTVDLKEELGDIDAVLAESRAALDEVDDDSAGGEAAPDDFHLGLDPGAAQDRSSVGPGRWIELALLTVANAIWAVVGLVLWLPQTARAVLWAALRTVHAALTQQSSARAVAGIQQVSRSYVDRFLGRRGEQAWVGRRHELRPFRLVGEVAWTCGFYLLVLRWLAPERFANVWSRLVAWAAVGRAWAGEFWTAAQGWLTPDLASLDFTRAQAAGILLVASLVGLVLGFWLGRRRR